MIKNIGFLGIGAMGEGMISKLLEAGYNVKVYDIDEAALNKASKMGAKKVSSANLVAKNVELVILSLPHPDIVKKVIVNEGVLEVLETGTYIIDTSTIDPKTTLYLSEKANKKGIQYLDSPVSGGPEGAANGTLAIMVGGDKKAYEELKDNYNVLGDNIYYIGKSGTAQVLKLGHNMVAASNVIALAEAFLIGVKSGINSKDMADVISKSVGRSGTLDIIVKPIVLEDNYENPKFMLKHMHKDLKLYMRTVEEYNGCSPLGSQTLELYNSAINNFDNHWDYSVVSKIIEYLNNEKII